MAEIPPKHQKKRYNYLGSEGGRTIEYCQMVCMFWCLLRGIKTNIFFTADILFRTTITNRTIHGCERVYPPDKLRILNS